MTDVDVGVLWKLEFPSLRDSIVNRSFIAIIVKLIDERACLIMAAGHIKGDNPLGVPTAHERACERFGVPYDEYLKAKGDT